MEAKRQRLGIIDDLKEGSYESMKRRAEDREREKVEGLAAKDFMLAVKGRDLM